jgi:hypothetical protein
MVDIKTFWPDVAVDHSGGVEYAGVEVGVEFIYLVRHMGLNLTDFIVDVAEVVERDLGGTLLDHWSRSGQLHLFWSLSFDRWFW